MPKCWITWNQRDREWEVSTTRPTDEQDVVEVEMNNSLLRQIKAAEKQFMKFQDILEKFYAEGVEHPGRARRVR